MQLETNCCYFKRTFLALFPGKGSRRHISHRTHCSTVPSFLFHLSKTQIWSALYTLAGEEQNYFLSQYLMLIRKTTHRVDLKVSPKHDLLRSLHELFDFFRLSTIDQVRFSYMTTFLDSKLQPLYTNSIIVCIKQLYTHKHTHTHLYVYI